MTRLDESRLDKNREISDALGRHYARTFQEHGATAKGMDWGREADVTLRFQQMLAVIRAENASVQPPSLLDVGCGYGGLLDHAQSAGVALDYSGIDVVADMIDHARRVHPEAAFVAGDLLDRDFGTRRYDYVVCSGILTQKLTTSNLDMHHFFQSLVRKMFSLCRKGIAFNIMTNCVNYTADNLYYRSPVEVLAFCLAELSTKVRLDHAYPLYEFTTYVYRDERWP